MAKAETAAAPAGCRYFFDVAGGGLRLPLRALAEREVCELVTADTRLLANLKPTFPFILDLVSLP